MTSPISPSANRFDTGSSTGALTEPLSESFGQGPAASEAVGGLLSQPQGSPANAFIGNRLFSDLNGNGIQDDGDVGVDGATV